MPPKAVQVSASGGYGVHTDPGPVPPRLCDLRQRLHLSALSFPNPQAVGIKTHSRGLLAPVALIYEAPTTCRAPRDGLCVRYL